MGSYHAGYRAGRAATEREQRKADYQNARIQAEKEFRAAFGRDWNQTERLQFDQDWRMVHLELPSNPLCDGYELGCFIFCIVLLLIVVFLAPALEKDLPELIFAAVVCSVIICMMLFKVYRYCQACKLIDQLGEKAWREQEIRRQEEKRYEPWEVSEKVPWK